VTTGVVDEEIGAWFAALLASCEMTSAMSSRGLTCGGCYTYSNPATDRAVYDCSNDETGDATITITGRGNGRGIGYIGGWPVIFVLGGIS
jgi:hypothetical protein